MVACWLNSLIDHRGYFEVALHWMRLVHCREHGGHSQRFVRSFVYMYTVVGALFRSQYVYM